MHLFYSTTLSKFSNCGLASVVFFFLVEILFLGKGVKFLEQHDAYLFLRGRTCNDVFWSCASVSATFWLFSRNFWCITIIWDCYKILSSSDMFYMMCGRKWIETRRALYNAVVVGKTDCERSFCLCWLCASFFGVFLRPWSGVTHGHGNKAKFSRALIAVFFFSLLSLIAAVPYYCN